MKTFFHHTRSPATALAVTFLVCGAVAGRAMVETEPNNEVKTANPVTMADKMQFTLEPLHDRDYFKLASPGRGTLRFKLTQSLKQHRGVHVWWGEDKGGEVRGGIWDRRVEAGETCILGVRSSYYDHNEVTNQEVIEGAFEFVAEQAASEPNDTPERAQPAKVGEKLSFTISPLHDHDFFKLASPGRGTLRFKLSQPLKQHRGLHVWWGTNKGGEVRSGLWDRWVEAGETAVMGVRSSYHDHNEVTHDEVIEGVFEFVAEQAASEPNDTPEQAQPAKVGEKLSFAISPLHDHDFFKVVSPGRGTLRFKLAQPLKQHRSVHVWWGANIGGEVRSGLWDRWVEAGETAVMGVRSSYYDHNEVTHDEIIEGLFEFVAERAASEPNDTPERAQPAKVGEKLSFTISPLHDRDYFKVLSPGRGTLRFNLAKPLIQHRSLFVWWGEDNGKEVRGGTWDRRVEAGETAFLGVRSNYYDHNEVTHDEVIEGLFEFVADSLPGEPNDTPAQAQQVQLNTLFETAFLPLHDRDYFKVASPGAGVIKLTRLDKHPVHRSLFPWWEGKANGSRIEGSWDRRVTQDETVVFGLRSAGYDWNETASETPITIQASFVKEPLDIEKGDSADEAAEAAIDQPFQFALMPSYDRDYLAVRCPRKGVLKAVFPRAPVERLNLWWQRADSKEAIHEATLPVAEGEMVFLALTPASWSSDEVFEGIVTYADGTESAGAQTRRWTFKIDRSQTPPVAAP